MDGNLPANQQQDIELLRQQDDHQFELAQMSIQANLQNSQEARAHFDKINENGKSIVLAAIAASFVFGMFALYLGKEDFLSDVLKVIVGVSVGLALGTCSASVNSNTIKLSASTDKDREHSYVSTKARRFTYGS